MPATNGTTTPANSALRCLSLGDLLITQSYYMLAIAVITIVFLSFFIRRKRLGVNCFNGRPGLLQPMNLIDDFGRRWMFAACFVILSTAIIDFVSNGYSTNWTRDKDSAWQTKFGWVSMFIFALIVIHISVIHYPLFTCVAHRRHIVANIAAIVYIIPLLVVQCLILSRCPVDGYYDFQRIIEIALLIWRLPCFLAHVVYLGGSVFELIVNIRKRQIAFRQSDVDEGNLILTTHYNEYHHNMLYIKGLMARKIVVDDDRLLNTGASYADRIKLWCTKFILYFKYTNVIGFRYSTRMIGTLVVSAVTVCIATIFFGSVVGVLTELFCRLFNICSGNVVSVTFHVSNTVSCVLQLVFMGHMLVTYRQRILRLFRGNHDWHCQLSLTPSTLLMNAMQYPGYQIAFFTFGWLFSMVLMFLCLLVISVVIISLRDGIISIYLITDWWPTIVVGLVICIGQQLLCRRFFLQDSSSLALDNRRLYFIVSYFLLFFNILLGFFAAIKRILLSAIIGSFIIGRLDYVLLMRGFEGLDTAHLTYLSMLIVDVTHNHPVMRTFVDLLQQQRNIKQSSSSTSLQVEGGLVPVRSKRARNKWLKLVTLINNPSLVYDRLYQQHKQWFNNQMHYESTLERKTFQPNHTVSDRPNNANSLS